MPDIVITGGSVVTMNDRGDIHHGGSVVIEGDRITEVRAEEWSRDDDASRGRSSRVIDASGAAVMPGLIDLHFHTAIERGGYSESLEVEDALFGYWYPMMRTLDADTTYWGALYSYLLGIKGGTTTVNDMFRHIEACAAAAEEIGIRATLSSLVARPEDGLDSLDDNAAAHAAVNGTADGRVQVAVGIEWLPLATADMLKGAADLATSLGTGIHIHLSESQQEVETSLDKFGARPVQVAYDVGLLSDNCVAAHCVWLSDDDIELIRETKTSVSHNPASNAKLGEGLARAPDLLKAGVNVGLGHDSTEGNNTMDMFDVMRTCVYLQRAVYNDPTLMSVDEVLTMATVNGATALNLNAGVIAPGHKADVILVDSNADFFDPSRSVYGANLPARLVFASNGSMVRTSIINGQIVMENRELKTVDEKTVVTETRKAVARLVNSLGR